ncbi:hypothetical protein SAMN05216570_2773 [Dyella sp. OK004]|uniref:hypothetical protein n=1 Tax=Dyella sp. OK004 TaxID=1855292 RepID=UPI0008F14CB9|nr:hypothetical protein [Dyella sp. OK004]SFS13002.1 hypothetical protein SAMN05216570_2773 [Dyella sp. OK004]
MSPTRLICALTLVGLVAGCGNDSSQFNVSTSGFSSIADGHIIVRDGVVTLHRDNAPNAVIHANGDLLIDDKAVAIDATQRELLKRYQQNAVAVREHGVATGKAGAAVAGAAIKGAVDSVTSGDSKEIDKQVDAQAKQVDLEAAKICEDLKGVQLAQDQLAASLPAFKPYAGILREDDDEDCKKESKDS